MIGKCVWFSASKVYGFLQDEATKKEYFCHFSSIQIDGYKKLEPEQRVEFSVIDGPKGKPQADNVVILD